MKLFYILEESIQAMRSNMLRSLLTIIGIVVGIFSVTMMLALGAGVTSSIVDDFNSFITGDITVSGELSLSDVMWLQDQSYVASALATRIIPDTSVVAFNNKFSPTVQVSVGDYVKINNATLVEGQWFDFADANFSERVAVVDQGFVNAVANTSKVTITASSSATIVIGGQMYKIIGIMEGGDSGFGGVLDGTVLIPYRSAVGVLTNTATFSSAGVDLVEQPYYKVAGKHILESLNTARGVQKDNEDYFTVTSAQSMIEELQSTTAMLSLFLGLIGGIALFVGGIGTMNMMLTTVTERTKEIGLRKAIGARDRDIMLQILTESVTLTLIGGVIGIALTYGVSLVVNSLLSDSLLISLVLSFKVVALATGVSFLVGVIFGLYPARNAAKLQPVDALRAD